MSYPAFRRFPEDELRDHFFLGPEEVALARSLRQEQNQLGLAVFLKTYQFLGYSLQCPEDIPRQIVDRISAQLGLPGSVSREYEWRNRLWMDHLGLLRKHFQRRAFEGTDRDPNKQNRL